MSRFSPHGLGWQRDLPDPRDYTLEHHKVLSLLERLQRSKDPVLPEKVDLRADGDGKYFLSAEDQRSLGSSSAFACLSLVEYFERRARGRTFEGSALFLHQMTRALLRRRGDGGTDLRTTFKALVRFGVPPEELWPYDPTAFDREPTHPSLLGFARDYRAIRYIRLDPHNTDGTQFLATIKSFLAAGFPIAFGFAVPSSLTTAPDIPYRPTLDSIRGGQAVVAVGYEDERRTTTHKGALRIRSSWGATWGRKGYGWLPYRYVTEQLAVDFWTLLSKRWLASGEFYRPSVVADIDGAVAT